jgi:oligopeptide/dipeptide ABC transporter ATP-binding protein
MVGLAQRLGSRRPRELSGGQLQRVAIARALAKSPSLIVLDEPVSSLDASTRAQVLELLRRLQAEYGISYVLIAHDLDMVRDISQDIVVMYLGRVVETGPARQVLTSPKHPYTQALMSAVPRLTGRGTSQPERITLRGEIPSPLAPPAGCRFHTRCPHVMDVCRSEDPVPVRQDGVTVACHLYSAPGASAARVASQPS